MNQKHWSGQNQKVHIPNQIAQAGVVTALAIKVLIVVYDLVGDF